MKIYYIIFAAFLLVSCASRQDKMNKIIKFYNTTELEMVDSYMKGMKAEKSAEDEITITITTDTPTNSTTAKMYNSIFPEIMKDVVFTLEEAKELARDGVRFNCVLLSTDNHVIVSRVFDKEYLKKNGTKGSGIMEKDGGTDIYKLAEIINKDLPMVDDASGITILKMEILSDTEAQFSYLVPEETMDILIEGEDISEFMKIDYLSNPKQKKALKDFFDMGLKKFYLTYINADKSKIKRIEFTPADVVG